MNKQLSDTTFTRETIEHMLFNLETKVKKAVDTVKKCEKDKDLHVFVSECIVYIRDQSLSIDVDIECCDYENSKYAVKLRGFNSVRCKDYCTPVKYVHDLSDVEKVVIGLILDLILK